MARVFLALALLSCAVFGQPIVDEHDVRQLLSASSFSDRAWGVFWVSRLHLPDADTLLVDQLDSVKRATADSSAEEKALVDTVFDALIETRVAVPARLLEYFLPQWCDPVVILLAQQEGSEELLLSMRKGELLRPQWIAVNNILFRKRSARFFAATLTDLKMTHTFVITDPNEPAPQRGGSGSGSWACGSRQLPKGFPPISVYQLFDAPHEGATLLAKGPKDAYYQRTAIPPSQSIAWGTGLGTFDRQEELLGYLAAWNQITLEAARWIFYSASTVDSRAIEDFQSFAESALTGQEFAIQNFVVRAREMGAGELSGVQLRITPIIEDYRHGGTPWPAVMAPKAFVIP